MEIVDKPASGDAAEREPERLAAVRALRLLDAQREERFDRITRLAATLCEAESAALTMIDADRIWPVSTFNMPREAIPRGQGLCYLAEKEGELIEILDTHEHPVARESPIVCGPPFTRYYATVPIFSRTGLRLASLGIGDTKPRQTPLSPVQRQGLIDLAAMAGEAMAQNETIERLHAERGELITHLRAVLSAAPLPLIVVAADGTLRGWNQAAERVFGWREDEVIGRFGPHCGPEHVAEGMMLTERIMQGERLQGFETIRRRKDGTRIPVAISSAPLRDEAGEIAGAVVVMEDISLRRMAEIAQEERNIRLRRQGNALRMATVEAAIESGDVPHALQAITRATLAATGLSHALIWLIDEKGARLERAAETVTGRAPETAVKQRDMLASLELPPDLADFIARYRSLGSDDALADQRLLPYLDSIASLGLGALACAPIFIGTTLQGLLAVLHYGTPRRWPADERAFLASLSDLAALAIEAGRRAAAVERLEKEKERAEAANRAKALFLANMGHELRTPLNAIIGFAGLLREPNLPPEQRAEFAEHVGQAGRHLLDVFNDVLEQARVDIGTLTLESRPLSVEPLLRDALAMARGPADARQIALRVEVAEKLPVVQADPVKLRQAVVNLLTNAVKFSPSEGEVSLRAACNEAGALCIEVSDQGPGVPPEERERVFEPFTQLDAGLARRTGGAGLGLPLARAYVELHGGRLTLEAGEAGGTLARIELPATLLGQPW